MRAKGSYRFVSVGQGGRDPYTASRHFGVGHPLAGVARERCLAAGHRLTWRGACGLCWESAVRDDERFVVECGLPRAVVVDPSDVDEVAVERACAGESVALTRVELRVAVARLLERGLGCGQIARRLHRDDTVIRRVLAVLRESGRGVAA